MNIYCAPGVSVELGPDYFAVWLDGELHMIWWGFWNWLFGSHGRRTWHMRRTFGQAKALALHMAMNGSPAADGYGSTQQQLRAEFEAAAAIEAIIRG